MSLLPGKRITDWVIAAGTLLTVATLIGGGLVYAVRLRDDASASMKSDTDHEARLRVIENVVSDVRADVRRDEDGRDVDPHVLGSASTAARRAQRSGANGIE